MLGWKIKKLSDVTTKIGSGSTPRGGKGAYKEEGISLIRSLNIHDKKFLKKDLAFIDDSQAEKLKNVIVEENDVLLNITGASVCRCSIVPDFVLPARVNQHVAILRSEPEFLDSKYLELCLTSEDYKRRLLHIATSGGATREALTKEQLENFEIPLPPLAEQRRIAAILDKADAIRRKQQQAIDLCDQFLKALFIDMFGDPVTNPKDWEVKKLGDFLSLKPTIGTIQPVSDEGTHKVVRVGEIGSRQVNLEACKNIIPTEKEYERSLLDEGDLILARAIGSEKLLGKASLFDGEEENVFFDSHVMRIRCDQKKLVPLFVYWWLSTDGGRALFMKRAGRTAVQFNINGKQFCLIDIAVPPLDLQNKFAEIVKKTEVKKAKMQKSLDRLNDNFNALSQKAFKGEL